MNGRADLVFGLEDSEKVYKALVPEAGDKIQRSNVHLELCPEGIKLGIESEDVVSLRAALNTWIRLVKIAWEMVKV
ncbi:MAG: KEOPS complex subunit Pcc1 [Methanotrichaceae archaeon]